MMSGGKTLKESIRKRKALKEKRVNMRRKNSIQLKEADPTEHSFKGNLPRT